MVKSMSNSTDIVHNTWDELSTKDKEFLLNHHLGELVWIRNGKIESTAKSEEDMLNCIVKSNHKGEGVVAEVGKTSETFELGY